MVLVVRTSFPSEAMKPNDESPELVMLLFVCERTPPLVVYQNMKHAANSISPTVRAVAAPLTMAPMEHAASLNPLTVQAPNVFTALRATQELLLIVMSDGVAVSPRSCAEPAPTMVGRLTPSS